MGISGSIKTFVLFFSGAVLGGIIGAAAVVPGNSDSLRQTLSVQESSAVVDVIKKASPSVVSITSKQNAPGFFFGQELGGQGTGIIVSSDGLIMTNKHVVASQDATLSVITSDGKEYKDAKLVGRDPINDIAFIKINAKGLSPAELGDSSTAQVGQRVIAIGNALGQFKNSATVGIISGLGRSVQASDSSGGNDESLQNLFQTDAAINPGNSGGPLVNLSGQVIGINTAVAGNGQGIGFAIPINEAKSILEGLRTNGRIVRPYLGVRYIPITPDFASNNNLPVTAGAYIYGQNPVLPGSPADKAGIKLDDIITKVNDKAIDDRHSLTALVGEYKVGEKVRLTLIRGGKTIKLDATLAEALSQ